MFTVVAPSSTDWRFPSPKRSNADLRGFEDCSITSGAFVGSVEEPSPLPLPFTRFTSQGFQLTVLRTEYGWIIERLTGHALVPGLNSEMMSQQKHGMWRLMVLTFVVAEGSEDSEDSEDSSGYSL